jgi:hypothetical protein
MREGGDRRHARDAGLVYQVDLVSLVDSRVRSSNEHFLL